MPYAFSDGDTARHIVLEVRLLSATTRLVDRGLSPLSTHSTLAKNDFRSMAIYVRVVVKFVLDVCHVHDIMQNYRKIAKDVASCSDKC